MINQSPQQRMNLKNTKKDNETNEEKPISSSHLHTDGGSRRERHDSVHKHHHHFAVVVIVSALVGGRLRRRRRKRTRNGVVAEAEEARQLPTTRTQNAVHQRGNSDGKPKGDVLLETIKRDVETNEVILRIVKLTFQPRASHFIRHPIRSLSQLGMWTRLTASNLVGGIATTG